MLPLAILAVGAGLALVASGGSGGAHAAPSSPANPGGGGGGGGGSAPSNPSTPSNPPLDPTYDNGGSSTTPYVNPDGVAVFPNQGNGDLGPAVDDTNGSSSDDGGSGDLGGAAGASGTNADDSWFSAGASLARRQSHPSHHGGMRVGQVPSDYSVPVAQGSEWIWSTQVGAWIPPYAGYTRGVPVPAGLPARRPLY